MPFTDHIVLQRHQPIRIEGEAKAGSRVTVSLADSRVTVAAAADGRWEAVLPSMAEATGLTLTAFSGNDTVRCTDVALGEVWLASGQSNMAFMLRQTDEAQLVTAQADDPLLRFFDMKPRYQTTWEPWGEEARREVNAGRYYALPAWTCSTPQTAARMSAVAYYFARMLRDSLQVPVGIIHNAIGGAPTEAWIGLGTLRSHLPEVLDDWTHNELIQDWVRRRTAENVGDEPSQQHPYKPGYLYTAGIEPLRHYPVAGVLWYQGESNAHNTVLHERLLELLVNDWRSYWQRPSMPFIFAQLSSMARPTWPAFRDSQRRMLQRLPGTGMAVTSDHGDSLDVHPHAKRPVGERMARWALHHTYSRLDITPSGPLPVKACAAGPVVCVTMQWGGGMCAADGQPLRCFEVAAADGVFHPASARVVVDGVLEVVCPEVLQPCFVRYAWQPFTRANLVNGDRLPASTFCLTVDNMENDGYMNGVSAAFAGISNGCPIVAGGCNFPENPLAKDSRKVLYDGIYELTGAQTLRLVGHLPRPMAYGASASTPDGVLMMGGTDSRDVWLVTMEGGNAVVKPLPSLPRAVDNAAACAIAGKVYLAGGNHDGKPSNALLCFDGAKWTELPPFPGNPRTQPVVAAGRNAKGEECLWLFGGFAGAGQGATLDTDGLVYIPSKKKWQAVAGPKDEEGMALSVAGGCAAALPDGRIVVTGGVNKDIFLAALRTPSPDYLSHPVEWYRFNSAVLLFNPATRQWQLPRRDAETARAGAMLIPRPDGSLMLYGGELKPRIRTPRITLLSL